jgi:glutamate/tyrosine decarboxylase-like PLP-dependent enzyme
LDEVFEQLAREVSRLWRDVRDLPTTPRATSEDVRRHLDRFYRGFEEPRPLQLLTEDVAAMLRAWSVHVIHPRYFGLYNPSVLPAGIAADTLVAAFNPQLAAWSHAPAANEIERFTLEKLATLIGYDPDTFSGHFTSGGAEANLTAVLAALAHTFHEYQEEGVGGIRGRPILYVSSEGHHSFDKISRMIGLGRRSLREVPADADLKMDVRRLTSFIREDREAGHRPFLIVATAGTTAAGTIDPLASLAALAREEGVWLHVDAAWGGGALLSPKLRHHLAGIDQADSVTWDAHKWLSVPMGAGMVFSRHAGAMQHAFGIETGYMPDRSTRPDPYASTAQWSRRFIGLKVFMSLAERGLHGYAELIEHQAAMGDRLRALLRGHGWSLINDTPFPLVCFTHPAIERGEVAIADILEHVSERGDVWISAARLGDGRTALRACITSFRTEEADLAVLLDVLEEALRGSEG